MNVNKIKEAIAMAERLRHIFVATSDSKGMPHIAAAGKLTLNPEGLLQVTSWFCPATVENLSKNKLISLVIWDGKTDTGHQLLGKVENIVELDILNGYAKEIEEKTPFPQVQRQLLIRPERIIEFKHAPHSDVEE